MKKLIKKYDIQGPRYTSYPPVPFWNGAPSFDNICSSIVEHYEDTLGIDLYIHVPFCFSICHYCGCNRIECSTNKSEETYVEALLEEWKQYKDKIGNVRIKSIHFGGGTPTYLTPKSFRKLFDIFEHNISDDFIGSIELHPRHTTEEHLSTFKELRIERVSIGVQDLNDVVLDSINRNCTVAEVISLYNQLRTLNFKSINFDLIYGLSYQTLKSMNETFKQVVELSPDTIAYYSFAFVPWKMENQSKIDITKVPEAELKKKLSELGKQILTDAGYNSVGLDHFAKKESFLGKAQAKKKLNRSFMGYVDKKSNILLGLGVSSISTTPNFYSQNTKEVSEYIKKDFKFINGHSMTANDTSIAQIIHDLMCNGVASVSGIAFDESIIKEMENDGLLKYKNNTIELTEIGMPFSRNVAMLFDEYLPSKGKSNMFSKTV